MAQLRILHLLSQTELTGAETYAIAIGENQVLAGHRVWLMSDKIHVPTQLPLIRAPIAKRSYVNRVKNILRLRAFIRENKVDVIHAHSRASSWVAFYATRLTGVSLVSTIHGRQHLHLSLKAKDIYGDQVIAVCGNIKDHLMEELGMRAEKIQEIPNGIEPLTKHENAVLTNRLAILGRTSGPKGDRLEDLLFHVIPYVLAKTKFDLIIAGGPLENLSAEAQVQYRKLAETFPDRLTSLGVLPVKNFEKLVNTSSLTLGSGRVAIKSLLLGRPLIALGESGYHGLVTEKNYTAARASNFGDICRLASEVEPTPNEDILKTILEIDRGELAGANLASRLRDDFDISVVSRQVTNVYHRAILSRKTKGWLPVLMYHKVENAPPISRHRTFITKERFASHLKFFRRHNFTSLTFQDLRMYLSGEREWEKFPKKPLVLTFDDGYVSTLSNAIPLLNEHGFRAVFYIVGDENIRHNKWDDHPGEDPAPLTDHKPLRALADAGHELGSHSMTHPRLTEVSLETAREEIRSSRAALQSKTGVEPTSFAYPFGNLNESLKKEVADAGFGFGIATDSGALRLEDDAFHVFRANIFPQDRGFQLWKKTSRWYRGYYRWKRGK